MPARRCTHKRRTSGLVQLELLRTDLTRSTYSAQVNVGICTSCGHIELYCQSHKAVCEWLAANTRKPSPKPN